MVAHNDDVERVRRATDIVDLVESFVPLKRAGSSYRAVCPFHDEKTPSFHVFPESQLYKCFGCNAAGDCFSFIQKRQGLSFRESLEWLAERAGIVLQKFERNAGPAGPSRKSSFDCLEAACEYYQSLLLRSPQVQDSLDKRGIDRNMRDHWRIGLAPQGWTTLQERLTKLGFTPDIQIAAGLAARSESGRVYDRFRDRITFPICDVLGRVVGFGARLLAGVPEGDEHGPKYLNSAENEIFTKRSLLYGLDKIARAPRTAAATAVDAPIVIMEGYTDVILAHAVGMRRAVATLGTALGRDHAKLIKRFSADVLLLYDGDEAGLRASERGVGILLEEGFSVRVAALPDDLDPADYILQNGGDAFLKEVGDGKDIISFLIDRIQSRLGHSRRSQDKLAACDEILALIAKVGTPTHRNDAVLKLTSAFGLSETVVHEHLSSILTKNAEAARYKTPAPVVAPRGETDERDRQAGEELLGSLLLDPSLWALVRGAGLTPEVFVNSGLRAVYSAALRCLEDGDEPDHHRIASRLDDSPYREIPAILWTHTATIAKTMSPSVILEKNLAYFTKNACDARVRDLKLQLRSAESVGAGAEAKRLQLEILQIQRNSRGGARHRSAGGDVPSAGNHNTYESGAGEEGHA